MIAIDDGDNDDNMPTGVGVFKGWKAYEMGCWAARDSLSASDGLKNHSFMTIPISGKLRTCMKARRDEKHQR